MRLNKLIPDPLLTSTLITSPAFKERIPLISIDAATVVKEISVQILVKGIVVLFLPIAKK
jgi:hypothetical protein